MEQTFATHSHLSSIRTVASNKHYLASGGADETVCLYDMRYRSENGKLMHHNGKSRSFTLNKYIKKLSEFNIPCVYF